MKRLLLFLQSSGLFYKKEFINFLIIRILNIFFPLLAYKHVLGVVGISNFGLFASANGIIIFFAVFTNYGFELYGPIEVSRHKEDDNNLVNKISSQIIFIKSVLSIIAFLLIFPIHFFVNFDLTLIIVSFQQIIFETFSLVFLFQGLNQLKLLINITLISRLLSTTLCLSFIKNSSQILLFPIFLGIGNIASLVYSYNIAYKKYNFRFHGFSYEELINFLKSSTLVFSGNLFGKVYQNGPRLFFSTLLNPVYSACYDVADKLINIILIPLSILTDSILRNAGENHISFQSKNKSLTIIFFISTLLIIPVILSSGFLIELLQTSDVDITKNILYLLSFAVLFSSLSNYLKIFHFINKRKFKFITVTVFLGMVFFLIMGISLNLLNKYNYYNGVLIFAIVEVLIFVSFILKYLRDYFSIKKV